jgi:hypothetical protein
MPDSKKNKDYKDAAAKRDAKKVSSGKSVNSAAFNAGFKYGKGEISRAEAMKLINASPTKVDLKNFNRTRFNKGTFSYTYPDRLSGEKGRVTAKQESAQEKRGGSMPVKPSSKKSKKK